MKKYTREEVYSKSVEYFDGDHLASDVFANKYALKKGKDYFESTPDDMHKRIAKELGRIEKKYKNPISEEEIYGLLKDFKYIVPQGSPMSGIGNDLSIQSLGNCFVIQSPHDSYGGIMKSDQELVQLMKRRAGVGMDISTLRPKDQVTQNAAGTTDGVGVFMERYSNSCREVAQNGRRGALMLSMSVHHPEIRTFVGIKHDKTKVTGANISVRLTDEFLEVVEQDEDYHTGLDDGCYETRWPVDSKNPVIKNRLNASSIWNEIIYHAWADAEPGLLFWDTIIRTSPADLYADIDARFRTVSTNPCGEIPMGEDSCRLLIINLLSFVVNPFTEDAYFDYEKFAEVSVKAQRLMDDLIDLEIEKIDKILAKIKSDPEPEYVKSVELRVWENFRETCTLGRRTGLGITALGDALAAVNIIYGSEEAITETEEIYKTLAINSYKASIIMAKERGAFELWDYKKEKDHTYLSRIISCLPLKYQNMYKKYGRRNIANTTTAPCGSLSCETRTTSGIECVFMLEYGRNRKIMQGEDIEPDFIDEMGDRWTSYNVKHPGFQKWQEVTGLTDPKDSPYHGATSVDVNWVNKIKMQAVAQKWICHAISCTVNLPEETTQEMVSKIYMEGWKSGCKGVTVYRDGCRTGVLVSPSSEEKIDIVLDDGAMITVNKSEEIEYGGKVVSAQDLMENFG